MKNNMKRDKTMKITVSAMLSSLGVVILYLGSVLNVFDLTAVAVVSFLMIFSRNDVGSPYCYFTYMAISILSFLLLPDKFAAIAFAVLGGSYPLIRPYIMKTGKYLRTALKLLFFNAVLTGLIAISMFVLHIEDEDLGFNVVTYGLCNFAFICFDFVITQYLRFYDEKIKRRLKIDKLFSEKTDKEEK